MGISGRSQTYIDIDLHNNRFYFPGDIVRGEVILDLAKPTKTQHIKLALTGDVQADSNSVKLFTKTILLAEAPDNKKTYILPAKLHKFPFEIQIPTKQECDLPSSAETLKHGTIRYYLLATHNKAALFGALSLQTKRSLAILEHIDVSLPHYNKTAEVTAILSPATTIHDHKVHMKASIPKTAIVRGDILPVTIEIKHFCVMSRKSAIKVQLIRRLHYGKTKGNILEQISIKTNLLNINIKNPANFSQVCLANIFIPTKTPPTIDRCGRLISVEYFIRIIVNMNERTIQPDNPKLFVFMELPVLIGTFPRPELFIDGEDDYDEEQEALEQAEEKKRCQSKESSNLNLSQFGISSPTLTEFLKDEKSNIPHPHEETFCVDIPSEGANRNPISPTRTLTRCPDIHRSSIPIALSIAMSHRNSSVSDTSTIVDNLTTSIIRHGTQRSSRSFDSRFSESTQGSISTLQGDIKQPTKD
ncbi:hypothetical protein J3Q64DRAFT_1852996 [Phycomyces blakesleeanus]|uniref:Arrestin C-terminal-like domain-containing protein n=2 Tax=Phycomyces blakesleeanus TaxID=4837 RepID=A0A162NLD2_PHYB8|nr:hypothetical protein PHYBLDRAFT_147328 [Phycomyces blakesleeanus NRRL 1555(-)]OAD71584.1 hypothetical protein PHYBLDRAFT_147328 [Phycomyces blakesleeanus NRRL 1555(-)]|eukprot:XP_018289624.1 hypothetical protein PHYBLDRAFT_147328 [Phycomyces blakesleeanus NRRL 1555(-)]